MVKRAKGKVRLAGKKRGGTVARLTRSEEEYQERGGARERGNMDYLYIKRGGGIIQKKCIVAVNTKGRQQLEEAARPGEIARAGDSFFN